MSIPSVIRILARNQPCGCIVCYCTDENRCHGCGAKTCGKHKTGHIPNPVYSDDVCLEISDGKSVELTPTLPTECGYYFAHYPEQDRTEILRVRVNRNTQKYVVDAIGQPCKYAEELWRYAAWLWSAKIMDCETYPAGE